MNDLTLPAESAEDAVLSEAEALVRLTVRENGDRVSMIRALEEMLSTLPVPPFADRRIALFREVGVLCYPGEVHHAAEACLERAGEWARRGDAAALRAWRLHELAVRAIARRDASDIPELRKRVGDPLSHNILGEAGDHLLYLACRAVADVDGATDALEQMSRSVRERLSEVVDEFAELPESTLVVTSPQGQIDAYSGARAAELRLPDLQGSSDHLLDLAISAAAVEDQSGLHPYRSARLTQMLAQEVGSSDREVDVAERAAMLHEIGKAAVPVSVLETGGANDRERALYDGYAGYGADLIERGRFPDSAEVARIVRSHAAPYDGQTGLLAGEALPLGARLVRIADAFDTLVCGRRAQPPVSVQDALREVLRQRGRDFDPRLPDHFIALVRRLELEHGDLLAFLEDGAEIPEARHRLGKFT